MRRFRSPLGFLALASFFLLSCADGDSPTELDLGVSAQLSVMPVFPSGAAQAAAGLPINVIQLTVLQVPGDVQVAQEVVSVNPDDPQWELGITVPLSNDPDVQYVIEIQLINETNGVRSVEWSARSAPVGLAPGTPTAIQQVEVARGPLDNLAVTGLVLSGPASTPEGTDFSIAATVQSNDPGASPTVFWTSLDPAVVSIAQDGSGSALQPGTARVQADVGNVTAIHEIVVTAVPVAVTIDPTTATATAAGVDLPFVAQVVDARGAPIPGEGVVWSLADDRVVSDQGGGVFRTLAGGSTTVTATSVSDPSLSASATIDVTIEPVSISIEQGPFTLVQPGETKDLSIVGTGAAGTPVLGLQAAWISSDPSVATVDASGRVTAAGTGQAVITAEFDTGSSGASGADGSSSVLLTATIDVTVELPAATVTVAPAAATLPSIGATISFTAQAFDVAGKPVANPAFTWASSNTAVATVDAATGLVQAVSAGTAQISATMDGASGAATVTVAPQNTIVQITVSPDPASIFEFNSQQFTAVATDAGGQVVPTAFVWSSNDQSVATVDQAGLAYGTSPGTATISASAQGVTGQAVLDVMSAYGGQGGTATYTTVGNTELVVGVASPTGTAHVFDATTIVSQVGASALVPVTGGGASSGTFVILADGSMTYQPSPGFIGTETYSVDDTGGLTHTVMVTVTGPTVWYHDTSASPGGSGTSYSPFDDTSGGTIGGAGDILFLFSGTYSNGVTLQASQELIGEPAGLAGAPVGTIVPPGGTRPQINESSGIAIELADNVIVDEIDVLDGDPAIEGVSVGSFTVSNVTVISSQWHGVDLNSMSGIIDFMNLEIQASSRSGFRLNGGNATVNVQLGTSGTTGINGSGDFTVDVSNLSGGSVNFSGAPIDVVGSDGIFLSNNAADITFNQQVVIDNPNADALQYQNSSGDAHFVDLRITNVGDAGIHASTNTGQLRVLDGWINVTDFDPIDLTGSDVDLTFQSIDLSSTGGHGIQMSNVTGMVTVTDMDLNVSGGGPALFLDQVGQFNVTDPSFSNIVVTGGDAVRIQNSGIGIDLNTLSATGGTANAVELVGVSGFLNASNGTIDSFTGAGMHIVNGSANVTYGGDITNPGAHPLFVQNHTGANLAFSGTLQSTAQGIELDANTSSTFTFSGLIDIASTTNPGLVAKGGGTIEATNAGNVISTTTGRGLEINGTNIGAAGVTFQSISSNGASEGIVINNAGTGPFTVTGTGAVPSGGTIQNSTGTGIEIDGVGAVSLTNMRIQSSTGIGAWIRNVPTLTFDQGQMLTGQSRNFLFDDVAGLTTITNSTITGSKHGNYWVGGPGTPSLLYDNNFTGSVPTGTFGVPIDADLFIQATTGSNATAVVSNSSFGAGSHVRHGVRATSTSFLDLILDNNTFAVTGQHGASIEALSGDIDVQIINGNLFDLTGKHGLQLKATSIGTLRAEVQQNTFQNSNWDQIYMETASTGVLEARIFDNTITGGPPFNPTGAIVGQFEGTGAARAYVHGNQINGHVNEGILLEGGLIAAGSSTTVELNLFSNNVDHSGTSEPIEFGFGENIAACIDVAGNITTTTNTGEGVFVSQSGSATIDMARLLGGAGTETMPVPIQDQLFYDNPSSSAQTVSVATSFTGVPTSSCTFPTAPTNTQNSPPAAIPQTVMTDGSTPQAIILEGSDADGNSLTFSIVTPPSNGSLGAVTPIGGSSATVTYTPSGTGSDPFTFQVDDGTGTISQAAVDVMNPGPMVQPIAYNVQAGMELVAGGATTPSTPHLVAVSNIFTPTPSLTAINTGTSATTQGGSVTLNSDGSFNYTPAAGFVGTDDFTVDAGAGGQATVTLNVQGPPVWFVNNLAASGGTGVSDDPFDIIGFAESGSLAGDIIFVHEGDGTSNGHDQGITLKANQELWGEASGLTVPFFGQVITPSPANRPVIDHSVLGAAVTLGGGNGVYGLTLQSTSGREGLRASGINLNGSVADNLVISAAGSGIELVSTSGALDVTNTLITGAGTAGIEIDSGSPSFTFNTGSALSNAGGIGIYVRNTTGGTQTFDGATLAAGDGIVIDNAGGTVQIDNATVSGTNKGVEITNSTGTFTFNNLTNTNTTSAAFNVDGGSPSVTVVTAGGTSTTNTSGHLVHVANTVGGFVTMSGGAMTDTGGEGIKIGPTGGFVTLNNAVTINNPNSGLANAGVDISGNNATVTFADLTVNSTAIPAFKAASGLATVTVSTGSLTTTGSGALEATSTILDLTLTSATSTNSTTRGIDIQSSSGSFTAPGGSIVDPADEAFYFDSNSGLNFTYGGSVTHTTGLSNYLIYLNANVGSSAFTFDGALGYMNTSGGSVGVFGTNNTGAAITFNGSLGFTTDAQGIQLSGGGTLQVLGASNGLTTGVAPAISLTDSEGPNVIDDVSLNTANASGASHGILLSQTTGSSSVLIRNSTIDLNDLDGINATTSGPGALALTVTNTTIQNSVDAGIFASASGSGSLGLFVDNSVGPVDINNNDYGVHMSTAGTAVGTLTIDNASITSITQDGIIADFGSIGSGLTGTITNNTIDNVGGYGINIDGLGDGVGTFTVTGNVLTNFGLDGLIASTDPAISPPNASDLALTLTNNNFTVSQYYGNAVVVRQEESGLVCAQLGGSGLENVFGDTGFNGYAIQVEQNGSGGQFQLEGLGANSTQGGFGSPVQGLLNADNTLAPGFNLMFEAFAPFVQYTAAAVGTCR